jgi:hypothetical protein
MNRRSNTNKRRPPRQRALTQQLTRAVAGGLRIVQPTPPPIQASMHVPFFKFRAETKTSLVNYEIRPTDFCRLFGMYTQTYDSAGDIQAIVVNMITRFRIRYVELWAITGQVALQWLNTGTDSTGSEATYTDSSTSDDRYAHLKAKPSANSPTSKWQNQTTTTGGFAIDLPEGGFLDVALDIYISNGDTTSILAFPSGSQIFPSFPFGVANYVDQGTGGAGNLLVQGWFNPLDPSTITPTPRP